MKLEFVRLTLGPLPNNVYLLGDADSGDAVVIDPSYDSRFVLARAEEHGWALRAVWLTHGHFDHMAGAVEVVNAFDPPLPIGLHPADLDWYRDEGGAGKFGMSIPQPPEPTLIFADGMRLAFREGAEPVVEVLHAPGHSAGHVMFYCEGLDALFCGDVIFRQGVGRTDLEDGDMDALMRSIREKVLTLPDETRLLPGHGPDSTVGFERGNNPYL
jgi:glyoxylase-like metal-dependent hydrolase (beta-lactamase superfamily II)